MSDKRGLLPGLGRREVMKALGVAGIASAFSTTASAETDGTFQVPGQTNAPLRRTKFEVEIELPGGAVPGWREIQLPSSITEPAEYREGQDPDHTNKLWGPTEHGDLKMVRGLKQGELMLWEWRKLVMDGKTEEARKDIVVKVLASDRTVGARFEIDRVWPKEYHPPSLDATAVGGDSAFGDEIIATEAVTCAFDTFRRVAPS